MTVTLSEVNCVMAHSRCLVNEQGVTALFDKLSDEITEQCQHLNPVVLCVMTGAVVAVGKLLPKLNFPLELDYIHVTRYQGGLSGHELEWKQLPATSLKGRTVIVVDDVLDVGITMAKLKAYCLEQGAVQCYTAVLVDKDSGKEKPVTADFIGYQAGSQYLYGLGMDYKGYLRNVNGLYECPSNLEELL